VKRIDVIYGGQLYSIGGRSLDDLRAEIERAVRSGGDWVAVNDGEGAFREALLFVGPGTPIAVIPIPDPPAE
jgi:hypothetical protein